MRTLFHFPLIPACRTVRLFLGEKRLPFEGIVEHPWHAQESFLDISPDGVLPALQEDNGLVISSAYAICEYLDEGYDGASFIGKTLAQRAEVRRITSWFDNVFGQHVSLRIIYERVLKRLKGGEQVSHPALRAANEVKSELLIYVDALAAERNWLAGEELSLADFTASSHLSCLDFLGDLDWKKYPAIHEWYARMKSRPCFRQLLTDRVPGVVPPIYYTDLDF